MSFSYYTFMCMLIIYTSRKLFTKLATFFKHETSGLRNVTRTFKNILMLTCTQVISCSIQKGMDECFSFFFCNPHPLQKQNKSISTFQCFCHHRMLLPWPPHSAEISSYDWNVCIWLVDSFFHKRDTFFAPKYCSYRL